MAGSAGSARIAWRQGLSGRAGARVPDRPSPRRHGALLRHIATERLAGALRRTSLCRRVLTGTRKSLAARGNLWAEPVVRHQLARAVVRTSELDALTLPTRPNGKLDRRASTAAGEPPGRSGGPGTTSS